jgi:hypothetical protein
MAKKTEVPEPEKMEKRTITLQDGRYMIFYDFGDFKTEEDVKGAETPPTHPAEAPRDV